MCKKYEFEISNIPFFTVIRTEENSKNCAGDYYVFKKFEINSEKKYKIKRDYLVQFEFEGVDTNKEFSLFLATHKENYVVAKTIWDKFLKNKEIIIDENNHKGNYIQQLRPRLLLTEEELFYLTLKYC